jgi:hypothetical protein
LKRKQSPTEIQAASGSAIKKTIRVVGEPVYGDLNGDNRKHAAMVLVHDPCGYGKFYCVVAAIVKSGQWQGTNADIIGDRVAPGTIRIHNGLIVARYTDRRPDQSMAQTPSVIKTLRQRDCLHKL